MDKSYEYEIHVEGYLSDQWSDWFEGLAIQHDPNDETILIGSLSDQAALYGVLNKIHALNLTLISVLRSPTVTMDGVKERASPTE
ncbi:MAG: hypothetical protein EHM70_14725 [Chloroflexota bacterium]|nr:MAG: hypothetical protein EHM70_14725 [Chloroflexota bacterium]